MSKKKSYEVMIPVYKKGDDLQHCIEKTNTHYEAFKLQASYYEGAADVCKRMASFLYENPGVRIEAADTHMVTISGTPEQCAPLLADEVIYHFHNDEDEDFLEDEEDSSSYLEEASSAYVDHIDEAYLRVKPSLEEAYASFEATCTSPSNLDSHLTRINNLKS